MTLDRMLLDLADAYETAASMPPVVERVAASGAGAPGSRMPPGMEAVMDADEHRRIITAADDWALHVWHVLLDLGVVAPLPDTTPDKLREAARFEDVLAADPREASGLWDDAADHLRHLTRLSLRSVRRVQVPTECLDVTCSGFYVAIITGPEVDGDIVCSRCGDRVPRETWERWGSRTEWITVQHAMSLTGAQTANAVYLRAKREGWRRQGQGREVRYHVDDVTSRTREVTTG